MEIDARSVQLGNEEEDCRRNLNIAAKNYNAALAAERKAKETLDKQKELDDNFTELSNQVQSCESFSIKLSINKDLFDYLVTFEFGL